MFLRRWKCHHSRTFPCCLSVALSRIGFCSLPVGKSTIRCWDPLALYFTEKKSSLHAKFIIWRSCSFKANRQNVDVRSKLVKLFPHPIFDRTSSIIDKDTLLRFWHYWVARCCNKDAFPSFYLDLKHTICLWLRLTGDTLCRWFCLPCLDSFFFLAYAPHRRPKSKQFYASTKNNCPVLLCSSTSVSISLLGSEEHNFSSQYVNYRDISLDFLCQNQISTNRR